ncbi:MAG: chemotaxis protein CheW [Chloroflexi bacterium]|nr:chemotaxis protein CheW [Chloroflexota bacterium]
MAHDEHVPSAFVSTFRQRFAPLFGRKIGRQRAEQYLGGLLNGKAERRNVTSLADTVDGASARALGWLLNKSPWPTRPVVDALQLYVGETFGTPDGLYTLNIDNFVKRGDNAVGVEKQFVHHLGRTSNSQIGVFLAYGSLTSSALVDAAIYMPHSWIDDADRREKAGVPASLEYKSRSTLAIELLREARQLGHLPGQWVTSWHGEGFEEDLRPRLDADGWRYLLPVPAAATFLDAPNAAEPRPYTTLLAGQPRSPLQLCRVWLPADVARADVARADVAHADAARAVEAQRAHWLLGCTDALSGAPVAFLSNAPEDEAAEMFERVMAARWQSVRMLAERCAGVSLDVYRVRGWDGWHRHVALALLASVFRACLPVLPSASDLEPEIIAEPDAVPVALAETPPAPPAAPLTEHPVDAPSDAVPAVSAPVIPHVEEEMAVSIDEPAYSAEEAPDEAPVAVPDAIPGAAPAVPTVYRLTVDISESEWRAVRAFQVYLVADEAGSIQSCVPSKAEIERQEVGQRIDITFLSPRSRDELLLALDEVPEVRVMELQAEGETAPAAEAEAAPAPAAAAPSGPIRYVLDVNIEETDWRAVRAFQVWLVADEAGSIQSCVPSKAEIERQEVGHQIHVEFDSPRSVEQIMASLREVPEISVLSLVTAGAELPVELVAAIASVEQADADEHLDLSDADDMLAALEAELSERTTAREAGLMPAFEGPIEVVGNAVIEASIILEESRELVVAGTNGANGHTNGAGGGSATLTAPIEPPVAPANEAPARAAAAAQPSTAPVAEKPAEPKEAAERARPEEEQMVVLDVGNESYGIPVKQVREIIRVPPITRVPNGPGFLEGVINLRGQVIPVMDLRKHLGIEGGGETRRSRVVVSELGRHTVGLMVDAVSEVVMISTTDIEPPPAIIAGANDGQIRGVARLGDRLVLFLDPERVLPNS